MKKNNSKNHSTSKKTKKINKENLVYFEHTSMKELYNCMEEWQKANHKRLLSLCIQKDGDKFCCIALTNPTEVVITDEDGYYFATVDKDGDLHTWTGIRNRAKVVITDKDGDEVSVTRNGDLCTYIRNEELEVSVSNILDANSNRY